MNRLTYEQAVKLVERGVLGSENFIEVDIPSLKHRECRVNKIMQAKKSKTLYIDIIYQDVIPNDRDPFFIPHTMVKSISGMPIDRVLVSYDMSDENKLEEIDIETDVVNEVIGKKFATIDGIELKEGLRFKFMNDKTPKYNNRIFTVKLDEDDLIKLVANRGRPKKM